MNQHNRESSLTTNLLPLQFRQGATLLTGATGFVGQAVLAEALRCEEPVRALSRRHMTQREGVAAQAAPWRFVAVGARMSCG